MKMTADQEFPNYKNHADEISALKESASNHCEQYREKALQTLDRELNEIRKNHGRLIRNCLLNFRITWTLWRIAIPTAIVTGIPPERILAKGRGRTIVLARRFCIWMTYSFGEFSYSRIAKTLGRDRSSVRKDVETAEADMERSDSYLYRLFFDVVRTESEFRISEP